MNDAVAALMKSFRKNLKPYLMLVCDAPANRRSITHCPQSRLVWAWCNWSNFTTSSCNVFHL